MWLLNTTSLELQFVEQASDHQYAILSHTWEEEEVTFVEMRSKISLEHKQGYRKVVACCRQAACDGFDFAWIDTCW